jgi:hypothetical protein
VSKGTKGPCTYGHGTATGGCTCEGYKGRRKGVCACGHERAWHKEAAPSETVPPELVRFARAWDEARDALISLMTKHPVRAGVMRVAVAEKVLRAPVASAPTLPVILRESPRDLKTAIRAFGLPLGAQKILTAIAMATPPGATRSQLSVLTGYKTRSINTYVQLLRQQEYVMRGSFQVTQSGLAVLGPSFKTLPTGDALREHWLNELTGGENALLVELVEAYPDSLSRERLCELTGYKTRSVNTYLQKLAARKLITKVGRERRASDELFDKKGVA